MLRYLWLSLLVIVLDQATKAWIQGTFLPYEMSEVLPFFNLILVFNEGAAFSFLSDAGGWQRWFFVLLAAGFSVWILLELRRLQRSEWPLAAAFGLVLGGALGNGLDRALQGDVTDFVLVHWRDWYFPAFNLADSAITLGAALWIGLALLELKQELQARRGRTGNTGSSGRDSAS